MRVIVAVAMAMLLLGTGCDLKTSKTQSTKDAYVIVMERPPVLTDQGVYRWGEEIGRIVASETAVTGATRLQVDFATHARPLLTTNAVFYVWAGRLNYAVLGTMGRPAEPGAGFLGFTSKSGFNWFRFKTLLRSSADVAARQAKHLAASFTAQ